ncbi:peptide chain release factor 1 [Acidiluteibacter ferrifornacis]|uniref:Peptide chain release factor 1 n=1 Tax=Acidiluteibacter ferrifornacis TaxID=2692424 RepID=A0A6N9NN01_9FLAO|nr:peptide chain release factor 1 [Acidiluteibacter ferrifornacis]MBR9832628.1 peptide chain release factor 1 [bacterium]NBG66590.1 peptide chain release factor 1 [Acidiluteibacter ferrifornacis]
MSNLLQKLQSIKERWDEVAQLIVDPEIISDMDRYVKLNKEYKDLEVFVVTYEEYKNVLENIVSSKDILAKEKDEEFREMAKMELDELIEKRDELEEKIKYMLIPKDPEDSKDVIVEIRGGTGGDEAAIFAGDLFNMYTRFVQSKGWKYEVLSMNEGTSGGFKEVSFSVSGDDIYGTLKYESGVHRVQRVPQTETQGRVHTSAATVAVLPEADEVDIKLNMSDVKKDTFRSSGAGGQHVNKTESAVRLTHIPTNTVVECQEGRSQIKNYEKALTVLRSRLYEKELAIKNAERAEHRKTLVSSGDRSAKIRTYNYPQGRVTDHRINLTVYNLDAIINGGALDEISDALKMAENTEKMKEGSIE